MFNSFQATWRSLSPGQRVALVGVLAVVFGGLMIVAQMATRPTYSVLFSNLEPDDAGAVTGKLKELKVEYRLSDGGRVIEVPEDRVYDLRLTLATEGLPRGGSVGFELFDKPNFSATDFTQHLNYQRALQGELTRTINRLDGVLDSRIHLAIPEQRLFTEKEEPVTASVVLHLRPGYQLDEQRVAGIVHLVSSAVEGLKPGNVTVHDAQGELLSGGGIKSLLTDNQIELQERYERRLESELRRLADQVLGPGRAAIRVSADLNWDETETTSETYRPGGPNGKNLPMEEQRTTETYGRGAGQAPRGVPGVTSNLNSPAVARAPELGARSADGGQYTNSHMDNRYAVSKVVERRVTPPGKVRRLSIAVLLDQKVTMVQQAALKNAFAAAAGLDLLPVSRGGRGDRIELLPMAFDKTATSEATRAADTAASQSFRIALFRNVAAVIVVILVMIASLLAARRLMAPQRQPFDALVAESVPLQPPGSPGPPLSGLGAQGEALLDSDPMARLNRPPAGEQPTGAIRQLAAERPDEVARQLQAWMAE